jgi:hypothetical protein
VTIVAQPGNSHTLQLAVNLLTLGIIENGIFAWVQFQHDDWCKTLRTSSSLDCRCDVEALIEGRIYLLGTCAMSAAPNPVRPGQSFDYRRANAANLPQELTQFKSWVVWKAAPHGRSGLRRNSRSAIASDGGVTLQRLCVIARASIPEAVARISELDKGRWIVELVFNGDSGVQWAILWSEPDGAGGAA